MGVRIVEGRGIAALYDSVTGIAFGPTFQGLDAHDQATHFLDWLADDARLLTPVGLLAAHQRWADQNLDADYGELTAKAARHTVSLL